MTTLLYDSSFEGYLTAIFDAYDRKLSVYRIRKEDGYTGEIFSDNIAVYTDKIKSARVWKGLCRKMTRTGQDYLQCAFLSELPEMEDVMQAFIRHIFSNTDNAEKDFSHDAVLRIQRVSKQVHRERHRMKAFIRFQLTRDEIYYASIEPDYNVIPLITTHFKNRYADQKWLIYDLRRKYGIYYDLEKVETITLDFAPGNEGGRNVSISLDEKEAFYQHLWQDYFKSVNIASRKNMTLHLRHVPRRYWKLLTEKL